MLGLLGGMAWPSSAEAYAQLNRRVAAARGGVASADLLLRSLDFAEVEALQRDDDWDGAGTLLADAARGLVAAGAGAIALLTNTMHRVAPAIEDAVDVPLLHVADATAAACHTAGARRVGLLGTRFSMEQAGVRDRLAAHGLEVLVPDDDGRARVHARIYDELVLGEVTDDARRDLAAAAAQVVEQGAGAVIAGCTEIELALGADDVTVPYVPTTATLMDACTAWLLHGTRPQAPPTSP